MLATDSFPPCSPSLTLEADCPTGYIKVNWIDVAKTCQGSNDVLTYELYHRPTVLAEYTLRGTFKQDGLKEYVSQSNPLISGCFVVLAVDSSGNKSKFSQDFCIDNCPIYELPNVFTPNKDNVNDNFKAIRVRQINEIDLKVFDRWGNIVYTSTDPYFKWNGISIITNQEVSAGTFFYVCDVFEPRLRGITKRTLKGIVTLMR